ncbi:MAG: hypothetical protein PF961_15405 [Planctomycetota bacterium]|jgi:hypothetical protein|nr:hypothetical protein [Planctomycetota bacterium]
MNYCSRTAALLLTLGAALSSPLLAAETIADGIATGLTTRQWEPIWQAGADKGAAASWAHDTTTWHSAPNSLKLVVPEGAGPANTRIGLFPGGTWPAAGTLSLTGVAKLSGSAKLIAVVSVSGFDDNWKRSFSADITAIKNPGSDAWQDISGQVEVPAGLRQIALQITVVEGHGTVWLDDIAFPALPLP